ncbi:MAG: CadC family transcriptional regulator [Caulobacterales bacterium RIFCSPHIGHO2_12_FULL_68_13]|nr:MAG: CadC family transcriptional regulator [Caulobacterales bacterium RIFCSPHIGHO2_12_FULL_68_13]
MTTVRSADARYRFAGFELDVAAGRLLADGEEVKLRRKAYQLLRLLVESDQRLLSKGEIIEALWPDRFASEDSLVQVVSDVRAGLGAGAGEIVVTVPRRGYRLGVPVETVRRPGVRTAPEVRYARSGAVRIAYQVVGEGPVDLVYVPGWVSHLEYGWESPLLAAFYEGLASFSRLILFDKRGTGLSDRAAGLPTIEQRMDDVRAVMDAAGSSRAAIFAMSEGGGMAMTFAALNPERVSALILFGAFARREWAPDYPWAPGPDERRRFYEAVEAQWGGPIGVEDLAPSLAADADFRDWWGAYQRRSASPAAALALAHMNTPIDVRRHLPAITAPTLVMHRRGDRDAHIDEGRYIARAIAGARFVALSGEDHLVFVGDQAAVLDHTRSFVAGHGAGERAR